MGAIQDALRHVYRQAPRRTELAALERLMSAEVLDAIRIEEESGLRHERHFDQRVFVDVAWIDKIPLAAFCAPVYDHHGHRIGARVEIGDLFVQRTHSQMHTPSSVRIASSRSLVVQAKLSDDSTPLVPVAPMNTKKVTSTSKELALLEHWPKFDLYPTSGSRLPIARDIEVDRSRPHSFYGAFSGKAQTWRFGRAAFGRPCDTDFDVLLGMLRDNTIGDDGGEWTRLTAGILHAASNRKIPRSLDASLRDRVQRVKTTVSGIDIDDFLNRFIRRKMAVLMIDQVDAEGPDIDGLWAAFAETPLESVRDDRRGAD